MNPGPSDLIVVVNLAASTLAFAFIARWYVWPWMEHQTVSQAIEPLLLLHVFRHVGLMFLAPGAIATTLPESFALPAAFGDLSAAILAFVALFALRSGWRRALTFVWVFNVVGTVDLVYAVGSGMVTGAASGMGTAFWIPAVFVPALLVTHFLVFWLLARTTDRLTTGAPSYENS